MVLALLSLCRSWPADLCTASGREAAQPARAQATLSPPLLLLRPPGTPLQGRPPRLQTMSLSLNTGSFLEVFLPHQSHWAQLQ